LKIEFMKDSHLKKILEIDQDAFQRDEPRKLLNLKGLREGDPEGCLVLIDGKDLFGYAFNKTMGEEGYLGPVGVKPIIHGQGWGQKLIHRSLDYLKSQCKVIGLEVRPEAGNNIGLYYKLGFESLFPSLIMEVPENFTIQQEASKWENEDEKECRTRDYNLEIFSDLSENRRRKFLDEIDLWTRHELKGISYRKDLELINADVGDVVIISQNNEPLGFLAYYSIVFLHFWGAIKPGICQKDILKECLQLFREINPQG
jgi:GNAT superfamily N-acetyltransferase